MGVIIFPYLAGLLSGSLFTFIFICILLRTGLKKRKQKNINKKSQSRKTADNIIYLSEYRQQKQKIATHKKIAVYENNGIMESRK